MERKERDKRSTKYQDKKKQQEHHFQPYRNLKDYKEIL